MSNQVETPDPTAQLEQTLQQTITQLGSLGYTIIDLKERMEDLGRENGNLEAELTEWRAEEFIMFQEKFGELIFALKDAEIARLTREVHPDKFGDITNEHGSIRRDEVRKLFDEARTEMLRMRGASEESE